MLASTLSQTPILAVLVPLIAGPIALLFGNRTFAFFISFIASAFSSLTSLYLLSLTIDGAVLSYRLGGWAPPLGIEYRIDAANAFVLVIVSAISTVMLPYFRTSITKEIREAQHTLFYTCYMLCFTGLMGVVVTGDAFNVFVFLEISSLATYVLVAMGAKQDKRALSAAYDYLILGTIGATFFVIGLGLIYMATGTLNMVDLSHRLATMEGNRTVRSAFAFIVIGMGLKIAIYPLHRWLPGAYAFAPSAVSAFLASTATKVAIYVLLRFMFSVFSVNFNFQQDTLEFIFLPLAIVAMFSASLVAVFQFNVKRLLAYSSVAQIGYMLLGITLLSIDGLSATMVHLFNHAITKGALFLAVGAIIYRTSSPLLPNMAGLGRKMPWTSAAIVIGGLSLIGVPGTAGFISKWMLLIAALEKDWWIIAFLIVASSLVAVVYVWKIVETLYLQPAKPNDRTTEAPLALLIPTWVLVLATLWFGINPEMTLTASNAAAEALFGSAFNGNNAIIMGLEGRP